LNPDSGKKGKGKRGKKGRHKETGKTLKGKKKKKEGKPPPMDCDEFSKFVFIPRGSNRGIIFRKRKGGGEEVT